MELVELKVVASMTYVLFSRPELSWYTGCALKIKYWTLRICTARPRPKLGRILPYIQQNPECFRRENKYRSVQELRISRIGTKSAVQLQSSLLLLKVKVKVRSRLCNLSRYWPLVDNQPMGEKYPYSQPAHFLSVSRYWRPFETYLAHMSWKHAKIS